MGPDSVGQAVSVAEWATAIFVGLAGMYLWLFARLARPKRPLPAPQQRQDVAETTQPSQQRLVQVNPDKTETDTDIDIIAIHGLDTKSPDTWEWVDRKDPGTRVNWLRDVHMLPSKVEGVRIFTCDWPSDLLQPSDLVQKTEEELARLLFEDIRRRVPATSDQVDRPILFIASCLGGIILMKALVGAGETYHSVRRATRGIVFLATPFRGTSFRKVEAWAKRGLGVWALIRGQQVSNQLDNVTESTFKVEGLVRKFTQLCQNKEYPCQVFNFYEMGKTSLPSKVFPWLPLWLRQEEQVRS